MTTHSIISLSISMTTLTITSLSILNKSNYLLLDYNSLGISTVATTFS
jgi:hypothetical protein